MLYDTISSYFIDVKPFARIVKKYQVDHQEHYSTVQLPSPGSAQQWSDALSLAYTSATFAMEPLEKSKIREVFAFQHAILLK